MILPICGESLYCLDVIFRNLIAPSVLLIIILNRPDKHQKTALWKYQNESFKQHLMTSYPQVTALSEKHFLLTEGDLPDALFLDFNEQAFHHNDGVGLARRIAADTACALIQTGFVTEPWIFSTDADVELPDDYFQVCKQCPDGTAISLNFSHITDDPVLGGYQERYDFRLKYYQQGVKHIGAAYDHIPLGSTLVVHAHAYAKVRGFPCRSGGEDFYLLNKLAKVGRIEQPSEPVVKIRVRQSDRVPFGTGPAVIKIKEQLAAGKEFTYYHPMIFERLRIWHEDLLSYFSENQLPQDRSLNEYWHVDKVLNKALQQINSVARWQQFVHEWFDAFKILKSVHFLEKSFDAKNIDELKQNELYQKIISC